MILTKKIPSVLAFWKTREPIQNLAEHLRWSILRKWLMVENKHPSSFRWSLPKPTDQCLQVILLNTFLECQTQTTLVQYKWKFFILIMTWVKHIFYTPIWAIWQMKDCKERNSFIFRTTFWKCLVPMPKCVWNLHHKNWILQWQKLYQELHTNL